MLTGKHKIGDGGAFVDFGIDPDYVVIDDGEGDKAVLTKGEAATLHALLSEHFGDGWTPCGPDGPFPPMGEQVLVTILMPKEGRRFVGVDWMKSPTEWSWWPGGSHEVVAWKPRAKPYDPKGQA